MKGRGLRSVDKEERSSEKSVLQEGTIDACTRTTTQTPTASGLIDVDRHIEPDHHSPRRETPAPWRRRSVFIDK